LTGKFFVHDAILSVNAMTPQSEAVRGKGTSGVPHLAHAFLPQSDTLLHASALLAGASLRS
jgi:hypothetical protein